MRQGNVIALASRIAEEAHKLIIRELKDYGIKGIVPSHGGIMALLFTGEKFTMKDLAEKINRTKPTVTVLVDKLVDLGYVIKEKSYEDSRVTYISLTEKGFALNPIFEEVSQKVNAVVYKDLSDEEAIYLEKLLGKIKKNLNE